MPTRVCLTPRFEMCNDELVRLLCGILRHGHTHALFKTRACIRPTIAYERNQVRRSPHRIIGKNALEKYEMCATLHTHTYLKPHPLGSLCCLTICPLHNTVWALHGNGTLTLISSAARRISGALCQQDVMAKMLWQASTPPSLEQ